MFAVFDRWRADARVLTGTSKAAFARRFGYSQCACTGDASCARCTALDDRSGCVFVHRADAPCGFCNKPLTILFEYEAYKRIAAALAPLVDAMCDDVDGLALLTAVVDIDLRGVARRWARVNYTNLSGAFTAQGRTACERDDKKAKAAAQKALAACKKLQARIDAHFAPDGPVAREAGARFERGRLDRLLARADTDDATARRAALGELRAALDEPSASAKKRKTRE